MVPVFRSIWSVLGSVSLWLKVMGIVVFPLLLVLSVVVIYIRQEIFTFLVDEGYTEALSGLYPILTQRAFLALFTTVLVGVLLAYGLSLVLVKPLRQLLSVIRQVKDGDLTARVGIWARDEVGSVQAAFNEMTQNLERSHNALVSYNLQMKAVNELAEVVTLGQGVDAVIELALNRVVAILQANAGFIYLFDQDGQDLRLKAVQGVISPELMRLMASQGQEKPIMQQVIETGHAYAIHDMDAPGFLPSELTETLARDGYLTWACAPLKMEGEVIGGFCLGLRNRRTISTNDLSLLEVIGNLVGFSISNAQLLSDLRRKEAELRRALRRAVELQEDERKRLALELHDEIGQALTSILIQLRTFEENRDSEDFGERLEGLRSLTSQTIEELRRLSMDLRPVVLDNLGIVPALKWYVEQAADRSGLNIKFNAPHHFDRLSPDIEMTLYRVAQEGLTNAIRHSKASSIDLCLDYSHKNVKLTILDNGRGFNTRTLESGLGLVGIRERVELLNGKVGIETSAGTGTRLWVEIPNPNNRAQMKGVRDD
jgi:signal transduction histidine kinase